MSYRAGMELGLDRFGRMQVHKMGNARAEEAHIRVAQLEVVELHVRFFEKRASMPCAYMQLQNP